MIFSSRFFRFFRFLVDVSLLLCVLWVTGRFILFLLDIFFFCHVVQYLCRFLFLFAKHSCLRYPSI